MNSEETVYVQSLENEIFHLKEHSKEEVKTVSAHKRRKPNRHGKDKLTLPKDLPIIRYS